MKDFRKFVLLDFDAEQVCLKLQVTNLKNNEVTVNPKTQTLEKIWFFEKLAHLFLAHLKQVFSAVSTKTQLS